VWSEPGDKAAPQMDGQLSIPIWQWEADCKHLESVLSLPVSFLLLISILSSLSPAGPVVGGLFFSLVVIPFLRGHRVQCPNQKLLRSNQLGVMTKSLAIKGCCVIWWALRLDDAVPILMSWDPPFLIMVLEEMEHCFILSGKAHSHYNVWLELRNTALVLGCLA